MIINKPKSRFSRKAIYSFVAVIALVLAGVVAAWAGEYTDKSYHGSDGTHTYKHPNQRSYTSPFDYGPTSAVRPAAPAKTGRCNCFTFDATKSYDVDGQKLTVEWNFGDGTTSDKAVDTHCYEKAGDYNVTLTVKDNSGQVCDTGVSSTKVSSNFPPTAVAGENKQACLGETVAFDASASTASGPATYTWDFGDGEAGEGMKVTHNYQKPGQYRVRMTVDDGKNTECSVAQSTLNVRIAERLTVTLVGPEVVCAGRTASFDANATGGSLKYHWDFGDGTTWDGGSRASHVYEKAGTYVVSVSVDNGQGFSCSTAVDTTSVKVGETPIARTGDNLVCCVGKEVTFDGSKSTGSGLSYRWDFGDGEGADGVTARHTYQKSGNYRVVLTVTNDSGTNCGVSSDSFVANVNTNPEAVIAVR